VGGSTVVSVATTRPYLLRIWVSDSLGCSIPTMCGTTSPGNGKPPGLARNQSRT
jgi:hypothetical protein